jgi:hypothetical protein
MSMNVTVLPPMVAIAMPIVQIQREVIHAHVPQTSDLKGMGKLASVSII